MVRSVYMKVTRDEYRLPLAVADSASEMARLQGTTRNAVYSSVSHGWGSYIKVEVDDDEEDDLK